MARNKYSPQPPTHHNQTTWSLGLQPLTLCNVLAPLPWDLLCGLKYAFTHSLLWSASTNVLISPRPCLSSIKRMVRSRDHIAVVNIHLLNLLWLCKTSTSTFSIMSPRLARFNLCSGLHHTNTRVVDRSPLAT